MYWYGWTVLSLIVGSVVGLLATLLPDSVAKKIPLALVWLLPILALIPLAYLADAVLDEVIWHANAAPRNAGRRSGRWTRDRWWHTLERSRCVSCLDK